MAVIDAPLIAVVAVHVMDAALLAVPVQIREVGFILLHVPANIVGIAHPLVSFPI